MYNANTSSYQNNKLAEAYRKLGQQEEKVTFGGRLGNYKYYDMAPIVEQVMQIHNP